jgi:hypothetical protein
VPKSPRWGKGSRILCRSCSWWPRTACKTIAFRSASAGTGFTYLHGHRHVTQFLTKQLTPAGSCHIAGAPSLLFGDELTHDHRSAGMGLTRLKTRDATTGVESHRMVKAWQCCSDSLM